MTWWMVASAVVSAYGTMKAGKAKAAEARARQAQLLEQREDAIVQSLQEHNIRISNFKTMQETNTAIAGVMGRDSGSDKSLKAIQDRAKKELDTETSRARLKFLGEQSQRSMAGKIAGMQAKNARTTAKINTVSSLLTAGKNLDDVGFFK